MTEGFGWLQAAAFTWVGHFYCEVARDAARAQKCYQRAVALDPTEGGAGDALVRLLCDTGQTTVAEALCRDALAKTQNQAVWAARRLGYLLAAQENHEEAAVCFQHALRHVPTPPEDQQAVAGVSPTEEQAAALWEALGASFFRLARHTAALKAFERALKLDGSPARLYAVTQSAAVHALLGAPDKAVAGYQAALQV